MSSEPTSERASIAARLLMVPIAGYRRFISPLIAPRCRFAPSCSQYALEALRVHGAARGLWLTVCRVARCHPFNPGGYDPVPERTDRSGHHRTWPGGHGGPSPRKKAAPTSARPQGVTR